MYLLAPLTLGLIGVIENHLLLKRTLPHDCILDMAAAATSSVIREHLISRANKELRDDYFLRIVTPVEFQTFLESQEGIELTAWLCLRVEHPGVFPTVTATRAILERSSPDELRRLAKARDLTSGLGNFCEADWQQEDGMVRPHVLEKRRKERATYYQPMGWRKNIKQMIAEGSLSLEMIRDLTFYAYRMLCCDEKELEQDAARVPLKGDK